MLAFNHVSLSEIEPDAKHVGTLGAGHASERGNQFAEQLLCSGAVPHADITKCQPLLESQAGAFVESRQYVGTLESGLEISGGDFRIIINQRDHALRGAVPDGDIRAKLRNSGEQSFLCSENGLCFRKRVL